MAVISWSKYVNKRILDSTSITMGNGGKKQDSSDIVKATRATSLNSPVKYNVTIDLNWSVKDDDGLSELDHFEYWYKNEHRHGANPFWFPSLSEFEINKGISTNTQKEKECQYVITSSPSFQRSGFCMRCTMTWEEVFVGQIKQSAVTDFTLVKWPEDVNRVIIDSSTITIGNQSLESSDADNGSKNTSRKSMVNPDSFQITMMFDWQSKDKNGKSEFDRFVEWYKYKHCYGTNPFDFQSIIRFNISGKTTACRYRITSEPSFSKEGFYMKCSMVWEEIYVGMLDIEITNTIDHIEAENGIVTLHYKDEISSDLKSPQVAFRTMDNSSVHNLSVTNEYTSGNKRYLYFNKLPSNTYIFGTLNSGSTTINSSCRTLVSF